LPAAAIAAAGAVNVDAHTPGQGQQVLAVFGLDYSAGAFECHAVLHGYSLPRHHGRVTNVAEIM
jgi:hypothetical protein